MTRFANDITRDARDLSVADRALSVSHLGGASEQSSSIGAYASGLLTVGRVCSGRVIVFSAEPDMGKTTIISRVCHDVDFLGGYSCYIDLSTLPATRVASRIVRACRETSHVVGHATPALLALDNVPPLDENDIAKVVRAIHKLVVVSGNVILGMVPEAEALVEEIDGVAHFRSTDLLVDSAPSSGLAELTHGIPALSRIVRLLGNSEINEVVNDTRYIAAVAQVAQHALRPTLLREEIELRIAMIELGSGTASDLRRVIGPIDQAILDCVARDAPFFSFDAEGFECAGLASTNVLRAVMRRIKTSVGEFPRVTSSVAGFLADHGEFQRSGVVLGAVPARERADLVLRYPTEFLDAGYCRMVEESVAIAAENGEMAGIREARASLACISGSEIDFENLRLSLKASGCRPVAELLASFRAALSKGVSNRPEAGHHPEGDDLCEALRVALQGLSLLAEYRFGDAYSLLLGCRARLAGPSFASCVLWTEYLLALSMSGHVPTAEDLSGFEEGIRFAGESGFAFLGQVMSTIRPVITLIIGTSDSGVAVESLAQHAALMGAIRIEALCLVASALADQRQGSSARAFVRLEQAAELAYRSGDSYLVSTCHILKCATKRSLEERVTADEVLSQRMPSRITMVARVLAAVIESSDAAHLDVMGRMRVGSCPEGTTWLVHALSSEFGALSLRFVNVVPRPWIAEARRTAIAAGEFRDHQPSPRQSSQEEAPEPKSYQLHVSMLGGFSVSVNGVPVDESCLERRRAKSLLALLAALPDHQARRYEAMESVWPELDYHDARQRVYEATSVLRCELTKKLGLKGVDPLVSNRGSGTLGLNRSCVDCDVDEFVETANLVLSDSSIRPSEVLGYCAALERMYHGDLFVPQVDGAGTIARRRDEIRQLYADVMAYASVQALSIQRVQAAVHYAQIACTLDGMREDAELCLINGLAASGRRLEAEASYQEFADRMIRNAKRPPSRELRDAYQQAIVGAEELVLHEGEGGESQAASA